MKKQEAQEIAIEKSRVMIEYLEQFLSDENITGKMMFGTAKVGKKDLCIVDIMLNNGFERHFNLGIPSVHCNVFTRQFTNDLADTFAKEKTKGVTPFFEMKSMPPVNRKGMDAISVDEETGKVNNHIKIDFCYGGQDFYDIMQEYNQKLKLAQEEMLQEQKEGNLHK